MVRNEIGEVRQSPRLIREAFLEVVSFDLRAESRDYAFAFWGMEQVAVDPAEACS